MIGAVNERIHQPSNAQGLPDPCFEMRVRVYYEDTDAGGIVYYANYLRFFERARTDWLRSMGAVHTELDAQRGLVFVVRDLAVEYLRPARLDDELIVDVRVLSTGRASMRLAQHARPAAGGPALVTSTVRVAAIERASGRPTGFPRWLTERVTAFPSHPPSPAHGEP